MNCPNCNYEPDINEFDWASEPGRFFELGIEERIDRIEQYLKLGQYAADYYD